MYKEKNIRSIIKTLSWRILATLLTTLIALFFVKELAIALTIGGIEFILKILFYYLHERFWNKLSFGKVVIEPNVIWLTGLSGSGKTTIADALKADLEKKKIKVQILDGDVIRNFLPKTGFSKEDRLAHARRVAFIAATLEKNGVTTIVSLITPYEESREFARSVCENYHEVYLATSLEECEKRDVKGLYKKVRNGEIQNFTGVDDPYEIPTKPNLIIDTKDLSITESINNLIKYLNKKNI